MTNPKMLIMGQIARQLRYLVGGTDINGFNITPANVVKAGPIITTLKELLDKYDNLMVEETTKRWD